MQLPLAMPKPRREPMDDDGSPVIEDRPSPTATDPMLEFGRFRVLMRQRRLLADGVPVELGTRAFDILMALLEADGALVTKDELQSRVWPGIVVAPENLKTQIYAVRKALGLDRELIRTENGRGYRFTATVRAVVTPEYLAAPGAITPLNGWKTALPTDLSVIASELVRLEDRLAEALNLLQTHRNRGRLRPRRYSLHSFSRRTRRRRPAPAPTLPRSRGRVGRGQRVIDLRKKLLDLAC